MLCNFLEEAMAVDSWLLILRFPYLCTPLLIQLHRHESRCSLLADGGVAALPEEVTALLLPGRWRLNLFRVLSSPNCRREMSLYLQHICSVISVPNWFPWARTGLLRTWFNPDSSIVRSSSSFYAPKYCKITLTGRRWTNLTLLLWCSS